MDRTTHDTDVRANQFARLKQWRERRGLTQVELAERVKQSQSKVARIESGDQDITLADAEAFAAILDTGPTDLLPGAPETVPVLYRAGSRFAEASGPAVCERPYLRLAVPPRLARVHECFAAELFDKSADRFGLAPGAFLIARELAAADWKLKPGDRVLVGRRENGAFSEVLAGELAPNIFGEVLVALRSSVKELPPVVAVRAHHTHIGLAERPELYLPEWVDCRPRPGDEAEILGKIERFIAPA